ncbi:MAG: flavin reductase family protein [Pseudonocardiaceae bacterium]
MTVPVAKAHRLLAPRIAYLIGTRDHLGTPNAILVSNVTSVSTDPQHILLAVHKKWHTYEVLLDREGFALSVPLMDHLEGVWKLATRYSHYPTTSPREKLAMSGLSFDYDASQHGPVLVNGTGWMDCRTIQCTDLGGDHGIIIGQPQHVWFNPEFLSPEGVPHTQTSPLMQVTGNRFTTTGRIMQIPYYGRDS